MRLTKTEQVSASARGLPPSAKGLPCPATVCQDLPGTATRNGMRAEGPDNVVRRAQTLVAVDLPAKSSVRARHHRTANRSRIKSEGFVDLKRDLQASTALSPPATSRNPRVEHSNGIHRRSFMRRKLRIRRGACTTIQDKTISHGGRETQRSNVRLLGEASRFSLTSLCSSLSVPQWLRESHLPGFLILVRFEDSTHPTGRDKLVLKATHS